MHGQNPEPLYIRKISSLAEKIVHEIYKRAIRGRPIVTRTAVREKCWIPIQQ